MTERTLVRAFGALAPVRDHLVIAGGTAHGLFPLHELGRDPGFELLATEDVDLAAPLELQHDDSRALLDRLEAAGFEERVGGAEYPAYTYHLRETGESYLQFIADLKGSGMKRSGRRDRSMKFSGIRAEKLRHVVILLHAPWEITLNVEDEEVRLQVVNPAAYLVQKLLVLEDRGSKQAKDLLYIFDSLTIFADSLGEFAARAPNLVPALQPKAKKRAKRAAESLCFQETDASRSAAVIAAEQRARPPNSKQIVDACALGLRQMLGPVVPDL